MKAGDGRAARYPRPVSISFRWLAAAVLLLAAAAGTVALARGMTAARQDPAAPAAFTWAGKTWDCAQVAAWDRRYGAYEPDGTPVPYEVAARCTLP